MQGGPDDDTEQDDLDGAAQEVVEPRLADAADDDADRVQGGDRDVHGAVDPRAEEEGQGRHEAEEALERVERTGRAALGEMQQLLGAMRWQGEPVGTAPQPGPDDLDALLVEVGRAGLPVCLHRDGIAVPLPRAVELSAYRIVQEGLTDTLKHARARRADASIRYGPGELCVEVRDDSTALVAQERLGHGLLGVRERVKVYGGQMSAGAVSTGGYVLRARLSLAGKRP